MRGGLQGNPGHDPGYVHWMLFSRLAAPGLRSLFYACFVFLLFVSCSRKEGLDTNAAFLTSPSESESLQVDMPVVFDISDASPLIAVRISVDDAPLIVESNLIAYRVESDYLALQSSGESNLIRKALVFEPDLGKWRHRTVYRFVLDFSPESAFDPAGPEDIDVVLTTPEGSVDNVWISSLVGMRYKGIFINKSDDDMPSRSTLIETVLNSNLSSIIFAEMGVGNIVSGSVFDLEELDHPDSSGRCWYKARGEIDYDAIHQLTYVVNCEYSSSMLATYSAIIMEENAP